MTTYAQVGIEIEKAKVLRLKNTSKAVFNR
jgi:hypothetical protein